MQRHVPFTCHERKTIMRPMLITIFSLTLFLACKKANTPKHGADSLIGKWELRHSIGGFAPQSSYPPGNGRIMILTDTTLESFSPGGYHSTQSYTKGDGYSYQTGRQMQAIVIDNYKTFYEFSGDTLVLYSGVVAADGTITKWLRINWHRKTILSTLCSGISS